MSEFLQPPLDAASKATGRRRLAVLDDDPDVAELLRQFFSFSGYEAEKFLSADALVSAAEKQPFDAYVLDWLLAGGQTSYEVISTTCRRYPQTPIILLSGNILLLQNAAPTLGALRASGVMVFEKPARLGSLKAALDNALAGPT